MKDITISESEYLRLVQTIQDLKAEIEGLKARFLPVEKNAKRYQNNLCPLLND